MSGPAIARVQVAGVHDAAEARMLAAAGVEWVGIPLRLPVNREDTTDEQAAAIVRECAGLGVEFVLITYLRQAAEIAELALRLGVYRVQIHGPIDAGGLLALRLALPGVVVIKSLVIRPGEGTGVVLRELGLLAPHVDAFITDTYNPATGASGATGLTHDWAVSRMVVGTSPRPVILAGGLTPVNVREAILTVQPAGVDSHTGVEGPDGRKDPERVRAFVAAARRGFAEADSGG
jgi:phosphoribosylanthranilate isomerase